MPRAYEITTITTNNYCHDGNHDYYYTTVVAGYYAVLLPRVCAININLLINESKAIAFNGQAIKNDIPEYTHTHTQVAVVFYACTYISILH